MNIKSAENAVEFVHTLEKDDKGRGTKFLVPGHEGKQYQVNVTRVEGQAKHCIQFTCTQTGETPEPCKGCLHTLVCYHALAALKASVLGVGHLRFFPTREIPTTLEEEFGRRVIRLENHSSRKVLWAVFWPHKPKRKRKPKEPTQQASLFPASALNGPYDRDHH